MLNKPVVFFIFNRPDTAELVFNEIAKVKPRKLLVVSDGPRNNRPDERKLVESSRRIIDRCDWDCEILKNYSDVNLGCKRRISTGIDWAFENIEEGIFLEDDCLPSESFFQYCDELLDKYRADNRIGIINGANHIMDKSKFSESTYYFSRYPHIWGWAMWRNRWQNSYDVNISAWPEVKKKNALSKIFDRKKEVEFWTTYFDHIYEGHIDTWDFQVAYMIFIGKYLAIAPSINLISNIGFSRDDATHTGSVSKYSNLKAHNIKFPIKHPKEVRRNIDFDMIESIEYSYLNLYQKIIRKLKEIIVKYKKIIW